MINDQNLKIVWSNAEWIILDIWNNINSKVSIARCLNGAVKRFFLTRWPQQKCWKLTNKQEMTETAHILVVWEQMVRG